MFTKHNPEGYSTPLPGIRRKTLVFGERMLMTEFLPFEISVEVDILVA